MILFEVTRKVDGQWQPCKFEELRPGDAFRCRAPKGIEQPWDADTIYICETMPEPDPGGMSFVRVHPEIEAANQQPVEIVPAGMHEQELRSRQFDPTCPWCRSQKVLLIEHEHVRDDEPEPFSYKYQAVCEDCGAGGPRTKTKDEAKSRWPDRPNTIELLMALLNEAIHGTVGSAQASIQFTQYLKQAAIQATTPRLSAERLRATFDKMVQNGPVLVVFRTDAPGVLCPPKLRQQQVAGLAFSPRFTNTSGQTTFISNDDGISQVLSFQGDDFVCVVPWKAILKIQMHADNKAERPALHVVSDEPQPQENV